MNSLKEFENQVKSLIIDQNWSEAYKVCNQILSYDPENSTFLRLKSKIEKEVKNINQRSIKHELDRLEEYLKKQQYEEYLRGIAPLQSYVKDFPEIGVKILQAKKLFDKQYQNKKIAAISEIETEIKRKGDQLNFEETIQKLEQLAQLGAEKEKIQKIDNNVKKKYISIQLKANQSLINSQKFEDIIIFLLKLKKIAPENQQLLGIIEKTKQRYQVQKVENKKDYIFSTSEEIKTLYITQKYDKSMELCERILEIDPKNVFAEEYLKKSKIKANRKSENLITSQIIENFKKFPQTKYFRDKDFIKI